MTEGYKVCKHCGAKNEFDSRFCGNCGIEWDTTLPYNLRHPEMNLMSYGNYSLKYSFPTSLFKSITPDYCEDPGGYGKHYLWFVKDGKVGIFYLNQKRWIIVNEYIVIKAEWDKIEKADGYFVCYRGGLKEYFDLEGNKLR
ncbi:MAG: zinc ribbon domain-containing protein [Bacteroidales bacterium]|nr:zinc ribbon domain-containing protein [Bacteroidales bacterium]